MSTYRTPVGTLRVEVVKDYNESSGIELFITTRYFIDEKEATADEVRDFWRRLHEMQAIAEESKGVG